eukprot:CAMPEP_0206251040 /NCGR_PEP_ID=MMETSP0047_2-20121206/21807_1 /ASSEMBLY_ACC=CAM_ASM_000192 /TAXON_ID=195065 /ORGANISM="Chroomonas mesostigmatica_cf, Strain CCMP1168" /LENGTH=146 /DNA_ID=CAMNT_0053676957 /DNA_START=91 /DNA_END=527 /DNA_ORIENTATION=+
MIASKYSAEQFYRTEGCSYSSIYSTTTIDSCLINGLTEAQCAMEGGTQWPASEGECDGLGSACMRWSVNTRIPQEQCEDRDVCDQAEYSWKKKYEWKPNRWIEQPAVVPLTWKKRELTKINSWNPKVLKEDRIRGIVEDAIASVMA